MASFSHRSNDAGKPSHPFISALISSLVCISSCTLRGERFLVGRYNSRRRDIICKFALISCEEVFSVEGTRRSGATTFRGRQFRAAAWPSHARFHAFQFARVRWSLPRLFAPNPLVRIFPCGPRPPDSFTSSLLTLSARSLNSHAWARALPSFAVLLRLVKRARGIALFFFFFPSVVPLFLLLRRSFLRARCTRAKKHAPLNAIIAWPFGS